MSVLEGSGLSIRPCLIGKFLHGALSAALTALALKLWPQAIAASDLLSSRWSSIHCPGWHWAPVCSAAD